MTMQNRRHGQKGDNGATGSATTRIHLIMVGATDEGGGVTTPEREEQEESPAEISVETSVDHTHDGKSLVILQVNCRSICNKMVEFWNLVETYNADAIIGTE